MNPTTPPGVLFLGHSPILHRHPFQWGYYNPASEVSLDTWMDLDLLNGLFPGHPWMEPEACVIRLTLCDPGDGTIPPPDWVRPFWAWRHLTTLNGYADSEVLAENSYMTWDGCSVPSMMVAGPDKGYTCINRPFYNWITALSGLSGKRHAVDVFQYFHMERQVRATNNPLWLTVEYARSVQSFEDHPWPVQYQNP